MRWFEDFREGEVTGVGPVTVTEDDILSFAQQFDPQPFHVDAEAARESPFGGLIASGWHTAALYMGMFVREVLLDSASLGSPGIEELRWTAPVRPGDTLRGRSRVLEARPSEKNPKRGTVYSEHEVLNQDDVVVMRFRSYGHFARRPTST
jgi:acyl dehydratase